MSLIIGIDPDFTGTGIISLDNGQIVEQVLIDSTAEHSGAITRVRCIVNMTKRIITRNKPNLIVIEGMAFGAKGQSVFDTGYLGYRLRELLIDERQKYIEPSPGQLKKFCTGKGNVAKNMILLHTFKRWGNEFNNDNIADAFVLAKIGEAYLGNTDGLTDFQKQVIASLKGEVPTKPKKKKVKKLVDE